MNGRTPRVWFGFLVVTMVVVLAGAVSLGAQEAGSQPSEQFFKNIQSTHPHASIIAEVKVYG